MTVFANNLEISSKKQGCKVIAAFPDTCFTPPLTPATPPGVPVPYPDFGMDSDLTSGTGTVKIGGETVSQENSSKYSKCSGDEAGSAPKKGIITSKNMGAVYAQKWSMDVKFEGKGVVRFSDIATSNHACNPGDSPPMAVIGTPGNPGFRDEEDCLVGSYDSIKNKCDGEAHHIVPDKCFRTGTRKMAEKGTPTITRTFDGVDYDIDERVPGAPTIGQGMCICLTEKQHLKAHELERDGFRALDGRDELAELSGKELATAKNAMKAAGNYGTADAWDVYAACQNSLYDIPGLDADCAEFAFNACELQFQHLEEGQTLRTGSPLPNGAAVDKMLGY